MGNSKEVVPIDTIISPSAPSGQSMLVPYAGYADFEVLAEAWNAKGSGRTGARGIGGWLGP
jgi:hypothetical protein